MRVLRDLRGKEVELEGEFSNNYVAPFPILYHIVSSHFLIIFATFSICLFCSFPTFEFVKKPSLPFYNPYNQFIHETPDAFQNHIS